MLELPLAFKEEMQELLKEDYERYEECMAHEPFRGIAVNTLKINADILLPLLSFDVKPTPFYRNGYYIPCNEDGIGSLPLHHAGAFYVQEPSAMSAVTLLDVQKGDKVLDLCAAPGGKSAQIAACLQNTGLLWSNEIVRNRVQILLSNFERMGIANGVVSSCHPDVLCQKLEGFFDKVLVDAPCSGEGMFRKNPDAVKEWSRSHVLSCAERQLSILHSAARAVKRGGILVYSTCTFSYEENEGVIRQFLAENQEFEMCEAPHFGRQTALSCAVRITPIEGGEGHFAARLRRKGESSAVAGKAVCHTPPKELEDIFTVPPQGNYTVIKDKLYILPEGLPDNSGLGVIRAGLLAGEYKKGRFEPAHALFMASKPEMVRRVLPADEQQVQAFLAGMEIKSDCPNGYTAVAYHGLVIGFGKTADSRLKNKYPKGLRNRH